MLTKRELLETAAVATVAAAGTTPGPLLGQERVAQAATELGRGNSHTRRPVRRGMVLLGGNPELCIHPSGTMLERERKLRLNPVALQACPGRGESGIHKGR